MGTLANLLEPKGSGWLCLVMASGNGQLSPWWIGFDRDVLVA